MGLLRFGISKKKEERIGKFLVVDGIDGSGKSTQLGLLQESLEAGGYDTEYIHFPQHGENSAAMVDAFLAGKFGNLNPHAVSVFFAIDRFEAAPRIRQWLKEGKIVLCDRYVTANAGHQGGKIENHAERVKFFRWLSNLEYEVFKIPRPDLNIILNVPADAAYQLIKIRNKEQKQNHVDVMHEVDRKHLEQSEEIYKEIGSLFPNTKMVECVENNTLLLPHQIHNKIWELVRRIVLKDMRPTR
jgi:dTMP kinase